MVGVLEMTMLVIFAGVVAGLALVPAFAFMFGPMMSMGALGRVLFTIGQLTLGKGSVLAKNERGHYELRPIEEVPPDYLADPPEEWPAGERRMAMLRDGEWIELDAPSGRWSRLGKAWFGVTYDKHPEVLERFTEDRPDLDMDAIAADGGVKVTDTVRGGYREFVPALDQFDGPVVRVNRLMQKLRGIGGPRLVDVAEQEALEEYGGDYEMSQTTIIVGSLAALVLGSATTYVVMVL